MNPRIVALLLLGTVPLLSACGSKEGAIEKGQVVATVNDKDVTVYELNAELKGVNLPSDPKQRKLVEKAALQRIINRKILANVATERKLDKTPDYLVLQQRANETLLVNLLQQQIVQQTPRPSSEDARRYMSQNPAYFADRKIYKLDQIQFAPTSQAILNALRPVKTLDGVQALLAQNKVQFRRAPSELDVLAIPPEAATKIAALPPGEVFVVPGNGALTANVIVESRVEPLDDATAQRVANNLIMRQRVGDATKGQLEKRVDEDLKKVRYQPGYEPPAESGKKG